MYFLALGKKQWALMFVLFYIFSPLCLFALPKNNMALVPSGKLLVTNKYESKEVKIENFFIDRFEVTQKLYETIIGINGSFFRGEQRPVEKINWFEAMEYCRRIGKRLPTEFEWEWAARARSKSKFYWGEKDPKVYSWFKKNSEKKTHSVGLKSPNSLGLYDMAGNVWEWCQDKYDYKAYEKEQQKGTTQNPKGPGKYNDPREPLSLKHVMRGGSFLCNDSYCSGYRVSRRMSSSKDSSFNHTGFRCVKDL